MANLDLFQALTPDQQSKLNVKELDNAINYLWQYTIDETHQYPTWFIRYGMPMKFPNGKYGFVVAGDMGLHVRPEPDPLDHRASQRYAEIPVHHIEFGELMRIVSPMTIYWDRDKVRFQNPEWYWGLMLKALSKSLPMYIKFLSYSIFKGKTKTMPKMERYITHYINPTNGSSDGIPFYLSEGYGEINLKKIINKAKVTEHKLCEALKKINAELTKDDKKIEVDADTDQTLSSKKWVKDNLSPDSKKFLAVLLKAQSEIAKILTDGFEEKYRVKKESFQGVNRDVKASDLVLMIPSESWRKLNTDLIYLTPGSQGFNLNSFNGVKVELVECMDENTAYIIEKDMIQFWVIPELIRNRVEPYAEGTTDYITEYAHTMEMIDIYHNIYIAHKA